jgi:hypothetical protein
MELTVVPERMDRRAMSDTRGDPPRQWCFPFEHLSVVFCLSIFGVNLEELVEKARTEGREETVVGERPPVKASLIASVVRALAVGAAMREVAVPEVPEVTGGMAATSCCSLLAKLLKAHLGW